MNTPKYEIRIGKIDLTHSGWILQRQFNILLANNNSNTAFMVSIKSMYSIKILKGMFLCKPHTNILSKRAVFYYRLEIYFQALSFYFLHIYPYHEAWTMHRFCAYFSTHSNRSKWSSRLFSMHWKTNQYLKPNMCEKFKPNYIS